MAQLESRFSGEKGRPVEDDFESLRAGSDDPQLGDVGSSAENIGGSGDTIPVSEDGCDWNIDCKRRGYSSLSLAVYTPVAVP